MTRLSAVHTANIPRHDPAPLLLVRGEIDRSLKRACKNLEAAPVENADVLTVQAAAADLHQVTGALLMVGLFAAAHLSGETEKVIDSINSGMPSEAIKKIQAIRQAKTSLSTYLDNLVDGKPDHPMELASAYVMLNKARGVDDASPNDLFLPDITAAASELNAAGISPRNEMTVEAIRRCRAIFQAGLLKLMRNKDLVGGASHMSDAIHAIEALDASSPSRDFWFTTIAFLDAVVNDPIGARPLAVPLFGKIDQQIRRLLEGDQIVPEKVFRELLLVIGKSAARTKRITRIRQLFRLDDLLWLPDGNAQSAQEEKLAPVVATLCQHINGMKNELQLFAEGHASALIALTSQAAMIARVGQQLPNREMVRLLHLLGAVGAHLGKTGSRPSATQALEIATALLFAESSLNDYFRLTSEFGRQASRTCLRIKNVMTGAELPDFNSSVDSLADTKTFQAQTHLLILQVGREVQDNLALIETALDGFFRDPSKKAGLVPIESLFGQIRGAFSIIEEEEAAGLAKVLAERVAQFASGAIMGEGGEADAVAEGVSGLGLYITGLQHGSPDAHAILLPTLIHFGILERPTLIPAVEKAARSAIDSAPAGSVNGTRIDAQRVSTTEVSTPQPDARAPDDAISTAATPSLLPDTNEIGDLQGPANSIAELTVSLQERNQRIRILQTQMVALHREARDAVALRVEIRKLRSLLAKAEAKPR
ncbi:MAG: hypothetical protein ABI583_01730 [Betaproteobacteria bacterium]